MSITQLASFNPRQLKQFSRSQINALPDALWSRLNRSQTRALVNAYSTQKRSSKAKRRDSDPSGSDLSAEVVVASNRFESWLDVGSLAPGRQSAEEELMALHNPLGDAQSDLPLRG